MVCRTAWAIGQLGWTQIGTNSTVAAGPRSSVHFQKLVVLKQCSVVFGELGL